MDPMQAAIKSQETKAELGLWIQPGLGQAYPELKAIFSRLREQVGKLPFVPLTWASQAQAIQDANPTAVVKLAPARMFNGSAATGMPPWIATSAQLDAWQAIVDAQGRAQSEYAAGQAAAGKAELDRLLSDAAFWNSPLMSAAISTQQVLRAAPEAVASAAGSVVSGVAGGLLKSAGWVLVLVAVGFVLWTGRKPIAEAAGRRIAKAVDK